MKSTDYLSLCDIQKELLDMLCRAGAWFKKNNITYSLSDGTLLGAVRHKGFIPWDDDIDIYIPRPDYEKWLALKEYFCLETGFDIRTPRDENFYWPFSKIINPKIRAQEDLNKYAYTGYLWIDVFPIDGVPDNEKSYKQLIDYRNFNIKLIGCVFIKGQTRLKDVFKNAFGSIILKLGNPYKIPNNIDKRCREIDYRTANNVACPAFGKTFMGKSIPREKFESTVDLPFEGTMQPCMSCWDEYLTKCYGDAYMELPPVDKRWNHPSKVWREE